jgi:hypothetical protein
LEADRILQKIENLETGLITRLEKRREEIAEKHVETFVKKQK